MFTPDKCVHRRMNLQLSKASSCGLNYLDALQKGIVRLMLSHLALDFLPTACDSDEIIL